jgi:hypothetical protein
MTEGVIPTTDLRPLAAGEVLDRAINLYRQNAVTLWKILAVVIVPIQVIEVIVRRVTLPSDVFLRNGQLYTFSGTTSGLVPLIIVGLLSFAAVLIANGAAFKAIGDAYLGHTPDWMDSLRYASSRLGALLVLSIAWVVLVGIGFVLIVLPGVFLLVAWCVAIPALMLEGKRGFASLGRSFDLVRGRWWATFGRLLAAIVLLIVASVVVGAIIGAIANGVKNVTLYVVLGGVSNVIADLLIIPFIAAVLTVIYIDLRVRKEAFDIEVLAQSLGSPVPVVPAASAAPAPTAAPEVPADAPPASSPSGSTPPPPLQPPPS